MIDWQYHHAGETIKAEHDVNALTLSAGDGYHIGWFTREIACTGLSCAFSVGATYAGSAHPFVAAAWRDNGGAFVQHDYFMPKTGGFELSMNLPDGAVSAYIQLGAYFTDSGAVSYDEPALNFAEIVPPRPVIVATAYTRRVLADNLVEILSATDMAAGSSHKPDILLFTESAFYYSCGVGYHESAMTLDHPYITAVRERAKRYGMYIILPIIERDGTIDYNTALLLDRAGEIVFKHRKTLLPYDEFINGLAMGNVINTFDTDFGRIAILICWEHNFSEPAAIARDKGAEILFIPSLGVTDAQLRARAADTGLYVVFAGPNPGTGRIISRFDAILAQTAGEDTMVATYAFDLSERDYKDWISFNTRSEPRSMFRVSRRDDLS